MTLDSNFVNSLQQAIMKELTSVDRPYRFTVDYAIEDVTGKVTILIYEDFHDAPDYKMLEAVEWLNSRLKNLGNQGIPISLEKVKHH